MLFFIIDFEKFEENALGGGGEGKSRELYFQTNISFTSIAKISDLSSLLCLVLKSTRWVRVMVSAAADQARFY